MLASEALIEDLAPVEPAKRAARVWCGALAIAYFGLAALALARSWPGGLDAAIPPVVLGGIALVAALARVTYRMRAVAMVVLGLLSALTGLFSAGAALHMVAGGTIWSLARTLAAMAIPAALLFRARYRAYGGARVFLAGALIIAVPFIVHLVTGLGDDFDARTIAAIVALVGIAASLTGFMGPETTGAGSALAPLLIAAFAIELAVRALSGGPASMGYRIEVAAFAATFASASGLAALGLFQILAWRFAADARRIDLHSKPVEPDDEPRSSGTDWMTGG